LKLSEPILQLNDLKTHFFTDMGVVRAVDGIRLSILQGETLGIVGESGSGKSVTALSILRLIDPPGRVVGGEVLFEGKNLLQYSKKEMREIRGNKISMIFQDPMASLNPLFKVSNQIEEAIKLHQHLGRKEAAGKALEMLRLVGIPSPEKRAKDFPHQLSGGMQQRVMIAMALACNPAVLIADEPTTALDVTIQAQILFLINQLKKEIGTAVLFITHDLGVISKISQNVAVMYTGKVVEYSNVYDLFDAPVHPYTQALLSAALPSHPDIVRELIILPGDVPSPLNPPKGCRFHTRCFKPTAICSEQTPPLQEISPGHFAACHIA